MTGEQRIEAPIEVDWAALNDPDVLRACIPGCQSLEVIGENRFRASATIKVGPISARFGGEVQLSELDPPNGYRITGEGSGGAAGSARGGARVALTRDGAATLLAYEVDADVQGRLASLGGKLIDVTAKQLAGVFFSRFAQEVGSRDFSEAAVAPAAAAAPAASASAAPRQPVAPAPAAPASSLGWLLALAAALVGGFILGRAASGWDGSGSLAGMAVGLLTVLAAFAGFAFGRRQPAQPQLVVLDADMLATLVARSREKGA
ncbi:MAG TPA: carbon monoxide dehydrogenase subunit G [Novosphingobium sp.]|nr:carbon monoxide dehydrogenase subunit G [Novosphingobium sp.]